MNIFVRSLSLVALMMLAGVAQAAGGRPVARILEIKGRVTAQATDAPDPAPARRLFAYGAVYDGDRLRAEPSSSLVLAFRGDGHVEALRGPDEVVVTAEGCRPTRRALSVARADEDLRRRRQVAVEALPTNVLGAGVLRGREDEPPRRLRPALRAVVPDVRPQFAWRASPVPNRYRFLIRVEGVEAAIWSHETTDASLMYAAEQPLDFGGQYEWEVSERGDDGVWQVVCEGRFRVATQSDGETARWLSASLDGDEVPLIALAALWFRRKDMVAETLAATQRLVTLAPDEPGYHRLRSEVLERAEDFAAAAAAVARARQLAGEPR